jgi:hypothetical protein
LHPTLSLYTKEQGRTLELDRERIGEVKKEDEDNHRHYLMDIFNVFNFISWLAPEK